MATTIKLNRHHKTDNANVQAKLDLRRHFLAKYHASEPPDVMDCCQGSGVLWQQLKSEFELRSYWGVDVKPKRGRLRLDSVRVLSQSGWPQNVIDIDTYGSPWDHWEAMLPNISKPTTVFLTSGLALKGIISLPEQAMKAMGLSLLWKNRTRNSLKNIQAKLYPCSVHWLLAMCYGHNLRMAEALEAITTGSARYYGVHLVPQPKMKMKMSAKPLPITPRPSGPGTL